MKKKDIEVIVSKELLNIVGHHLEICITVKNEDNKTAPTAYGDMVEFMRGLSRRKRLPANSARQKPIAPPSIVGCVSLTLKRPCLGRWSRHVQ